MVDPYSLLLITGTFACVIVYVRWTGWAHAHARTATAQNRSHHRIVLRPCHTSRQLITSPLQGPASSPRGGVTNGEATRYISPERTRSRGLRRYPDAEWGTI